MPRKSEQEVLKAEHDRIQGFIIDLLREEENKYCADCDAKGPRWASWNLGVFLCIRCAGIHRNLGVHLTRVKSVNLDTWTPEQVQSMRVMGNAKAKIAYEAGLPEHFRRPQTDQALETFIRAKYEHKRYILKDWTPPKANVADLPGCGGVEDGGKGAKPKKTTTTLPLPSSRSSVPTISSTTQKSVPTVKSHQPIPDASVDLPSSDLQLVDLSSPPPIVSSQPPIVSYSSQFATDQPIANEGISDIFGPIVSTTVAAVGNSSTAPPTPCTEQHSPSMTHSSINSMSDPNFLSLNETNDATHKSNSDILALFRNNTSNSQQQPNLMSQQQYAPPSSLLAGLYTPTPPPPTYHQQPYHNTGYAPPQPPSLINTATPDFGMFPNSGAYQQFTNLSTQQQQQPSNDFGAFMQSSMTTKSSSTFGQLSATNGSNISRSTGSMAPPTATAVDFDINLWR